jgi:hypothetical protein
MTPSPSEILWWPQVLASRKPIIFGILIIRRVSAILTIGLWTDDSVWHSQSNRWIQQYYDCGLFSTCLETTNVNVNERKQCKRVSFVSSRYQSNRILSI